MATLALKGTNSFKTAVFQTFSLKTVGVRECRQVGHDEVVKVLIGEFADEARMAPMTVSDDAWSDIRMRAAAHDKAVIGDPGGFWMFYFPKRASFNVSLRLRKFASTHSLCPLRPSSAWAK